MPSFIFTYHGGDLPATPAEGEAHKAEWQAWAAGLGAALTNPGTPVGATRVLTADGVSNDPSPHPMLGFSIIEAADLDAALKLLEDCPHLRYGGTLEVAEMMPMPA
ncbi:MAG: hypothetical protein QNJ91_11685 [Gammaproteobacteria bacterium]|nr:hypothetical protein [Gammaproteobacteria bacterium]